MRRRGKLIHLPNEQGWERQRSSSWFSVAAGPHHLLEMDMASEEFDRPRPLSGTDAGVVSRSVFRVPEGICVTEILDLDSTEFRANQYSGALQPGVRQRVYSPEEFDSLPTYMKVMK